VITTAAHECCKRSPLTYLERARGVPIDINHGIHDGHGNNSVPISQSLRAFNELAAPEDCFTETRSNTLLAKRKSRRTCEAKCLILRRVV
jgi:hypothetical protein